VQSQVGESRPHSCLAGWRRIAKHSSAFWEKQGFAVKLGDKVTGRRHLGAKTLSAPPKGGSKPAAGPVPLETIEAELAAGPLSARALHEGLGYEGSRFYTQIDKPRQLLQIDAHFSTSERERVGLWRSATWWRER